MLPACFSRCGLSHLIRTAVRRLPLFRTDSLKVFTIAGKVFGCVLDLALSMINLSFLPTLSAYALAVIQTTMKKAAANSKKVPVHIRFAIGATTIQAVGTAQPT
jgi:hypothetical protein